MKKLLAFLVLTVALAMPVAASASTPRGFWRPMLALPAPIRSHFACILKLESGSSFARLNLHDNNAHGSSGIFQIEQATFAAYQVAAGVPRRTNRGHTIHVWQASPYQQELVAIAIWRADGFSQWDPFDGC